MQIAIMIRQSKKKETATNQSGQNLYTLIVNDALLKTLAANLNVVSHDLTVNVLPTPNMILFLSLSTISTPMQEIDPETTSGESVKSTFTFANTKRNQLQTKLRESQTHGGDFFYVLKGINCAAWLTSDDTKCVMKGSVQILQQGQHDTTSTFWSSGFQLHHRTNISTVIINLYFYISISYLQ